MFIAVSLTLAALAPTPAMTPVPKIDRPLPTYVWVEPDPTRLYAAGDPLVLYMNRHGGTFTCGNDDATHNRSSIACGADNGVATVTPFAGSDQQWQTVMGCITDLYSRFRITVTDVQPLDATYIEAVIGGSPGQTGEPNGVAGVAPFSCALEPGAIVYDFSDVWGNDLQSVCETAGQEVAHAFGLDHELLCEDPMTYLTGCGPKTFQDQYVPCGEFEARECTCGDPTQNSVDAMLNLFGPADGTVWTPPVDNAPPTATLTAPADGDILPAADPLVITANVHDDAGLTLVELEWDFTGDFLFCPPAADARDSYTCTRDGDVATWTIPAGIGSRTFRVHVRDVAGNDVVTPDATVWLSPDGSGPPEDHTNPTIVLDAPLPGAQLPTSTPFEIVATMLDDNGVASAELNWTFRGGDNWLPCPFDNGRQSCVVDGNTYRWTVQTRRAADRTFQLRATDVVGNVTTTDVFTVSVADGVAAPVLPGNESFDHPKKLGCGDDVTVDGASAAWFTLDTPKGARVSVSTKNAPAGDLLATDGKAIVAHGTEAFSLTATDTPLTVGYQPASANGGEVTLSVRCKVPKPAPAAGCAASSVPSAFALLGILALRRRRRL